MKDVNVNKEIFMILVKTALFMACVRLLPRIILEIRGAVQ